MSLFLIFALLAGSLGSIASGVIGSYVVIKRIVFISGSISHAVFGGLGLALYLNRTLNLPWLSPLIGAFTFAIISALLIGWISLRFKEREDTVIGALWASGMALGIIFLSLTPGSTSEIFAFLFGNILWVNTADLITLIIINLLILTSVTLFYRPLLAICFDENQAKLQHVSTTMLYLFLLCLVAITTVVLIQIVGAILVIAMLCLPAAIASRFTFHLPRMMTLAALLGIAFTALGLWISYGLDWPPGATIALTATVGYLLSLSIKKITL